MILTFHHINRGGNGDYWSYYSVIFETTSKFPISFLWLVSGKLVVDGVTGSQRQSDMRYESDLKIILKNLKCKIEILATVFGWISKHQSNLLLFLLNWYCRKLGLTDLNINFLNIFRHKFYFKPILQVLDRDILYESLINSRLLWAMTWNNEHESEYEAVPRISIWMNFHTIITLFEFVTLKLFCLTLSKTFQTTKNKNIFRNFCW